MSRRGLKWGVGLLVLLAALSACKAWACKDALLNVTGGQIPNDSGSNGATKMTIENNAQLGGKALKVVFAPGDSFGVRSSKVRNWKPYITLEFEVFNPEKGDVVLQFNVRHKRSTSYQTRVEQGFTVKPGKNSIKIGLDEMANVNGSAPDLSDAQRWYINPTEGKSPTLYFGDIWLVSADATVSLPGVAEAGPNKPVATDPARLARIRAAKMPPITRPVMFNTPEADAILAALKSSRPITRGTNLSRTGRCTRTRKRSSLPSARINHSVTTPTLLVTRLPQSDAQMRKGFPSRRQRRGFDIGWARPATGSSTSFASSQVHRAPGSLFWAKPGALRRRRTGGWRAGCDADRQPSSCPRPQTGAQIRRTGEGCGHRSGARGGWSASDTACVPKGTCAPRCGPAARTSRRV